MMLTGEKSFFVTGTRFTTPPDAESNPFAVTVTATLPPLAEETRTYAKNVVLNQDDFSGDIVASANFTAKACPNLGSVQARQGKVTLSHGTMVRHNVEAGEVLKILDSTVLGSAMVTGSITMQKGDAQSLSAGEDILAKTARIARDVEAAGEIALLDGCVVKGAVKAGTKVYVEHTADPLGSLYADEGSVETYEADVEKTVTAGKDIRFVRGNCGEFLQANGSVTVEHCKSIGGIDAGENVTAVDVLSLGNISGNGDVSLNYTDVRGDVYAEGCLTIENDCEIAGNLYSGDHTVISDSTVLGLLRSWSPVVVLQNTQIEQDITFIEVPEATLELRGTSCVKGSIRFEAVKGTVLVHSEASVQEVLGGECIRVDS